MCLESCVGGENMTKTNKEVIKYIEEQFDNKCKVVSAKSEKDFNDLGYKVNVWNVKTNNEGAWWVVEGEEIPMNLYPQDAYYFSADEAYSFHIGIMERLFVRENKFNPENYIKAISLDRDIAPILLRKLKNIAQLIDAAMEIEDFQSIGVQCREILIELGNSIYKPEMAICDEQPQKSNFKKKAELFANYCLEGSENSDYRNYIKKITEATWDYSNKITHSQDSTYYDVSICVTLVISLVCLYENIQQKTSDPFSKTICKYCKSKKLSIVNDESVDKEMLQKICLKCEECGHVMEIDLKS